MIYLKCLSGTQSAVTLSCGCWRTKQAPKLTNILKMRVYNDRDCPHWHVLDCCREQQRAEHESRESNWAVFNHAHISMSPECEGLRCTVIPKWWIQYFCNPPWIKAESRDWIWTEIPCSGVQRQSEEKKCHCPKTYKPNCNSLATERLNFQQHPC